MRGSEDVPARAALLGYVGPADGKSTKRAEQEDRYLEDGFWDLKSLAKRHIRVERLPIFLRRGP
jgi:hypothetical protein